MAGKKALQGKTGLAGIPILELKCFGYYRGGADTVSLAALRIQVYRITPNSIPRLTTGSAFRVRIPVYMAR